MGEGVLNQGVKVLARCFRPGVNIGALRYLTFKFNLSFAVKFILFEDSPLRK
jgi:hypothetical protein